VFITAKYKDNNMSVDEICVDEITLDGLNQVNEVDNSVSYDAKGKLSVVLPEEWDIAALGNLVLSLQDKQHVRGVSTLLERIEQYARQVALSKSTWEKMETSVRFLSGTRNRSDAPRQMKKETVATRFYNTLSTSALRQHCVLFNLDYNSYESVDAVINALVKKQVEMAATQ